MRQLDHRNLTSLNPASLSSSPRLQSSFRPSPQLPISTNSGGLVASGSPSRVFQSQGTSLASAPHRAAPVLQIQANAAAAITSPSQSSDRCEQGESLTFRQGLKAALTGNSGIKAITRGTSRLGLASRSLGAVAGTAAGVLGLPSGVRQARESLREALRTGERSDVAKAFGDISGAGSSAAQLAKNSLGTYGVAARQVAKHQARKAATEAFKQVAPKASQEVVKAASRQAAQEALNQTKAKLAQRAVTGAAVETAKSTSTLARGAGATTRTAAKEVLKQGGTSAAKAATTAAAKSAAKSGAKAAGRFVPGVNVAIAALDSAQAAATLADPKASTAKKVTSVITAAGSIAAATNIPGVSQAGAVVSAVSSFVGSFWKR